jgi:hypothetical protein
LRRVAALSAIHDVYRDGAEAALRLKVRGMKGPQDIRQEFLLV